MPTKKDSAKSPKRLNASSNKHTALGRRLIRGMQEVAAHLDGTHKLPVYEYEVPDHVDVRAIRERLGLSQAEFAKRFALSPRTLQEWEQGRRVPEGPVRAYLIVIDRNPNAVVQALGG